MQRAQNGAVGGALNNMHMHHVQLRVTGRNGIKLSVVIVAVCNGRKFGGGPKECTDPAERPGGSMMEQGDVAWAGGSAGPDFFIMMTRNGNEKSKFCCIDLSTGLSKPNSHRKTLRDKFSPKNIA